MTINGLYHLIKGERYIHVHVHVYTFISEVLLYTNDTFDNLQSGVCCLS